MTTSVSIPVVLIVCAGVLFAQAGTTATNMNDPSGATRPDYSLELTVPVYNGAPPPMIEAEAGSGGAVYNPFAETSGKTFGADVQTSTSANVEGTDLTPAAIAALAAVAALAYMVRRAWVA